MKNTFSSIDAQRERQQQQQAAQQAASLLYTPMATPYQQQLQGGDGDEQESAETDSADDGTSEDGTAIAEGDKPSGLTQAQVQKMISDALQTSLTAHQEEISNLVDTRNQGLAANLSREIKKLRESRSKSTTDGEKTTRKAKAKDEDEGDEGDEPATKTRTRAKAKSSESDEGDRGYEDETPLAVQALQTQLAQLRNELADKEKTQFRLNSQAALTDAIQAVGAQSPGVLRQLLTATYDGKLVEQEGKYYVKDGKSVVPVLDAVTAYLATEDGKIFVRPSGVNGSGATETRAVAARQQPSAKKSLQEMLAEVKNGKGQFKI